MKSIISLLSALSLCTVVLLLVYCGPQPIVITSPAAGAKLLAGDTISVQWTPSITNPKLSYNYHLASSVWDTFATVIPVNSQETKVALPAMWYSDSFQIKVEDNDGTHGAGVSGYLHLKYIILTTALTGHIVKVGDTVNLTWRLYPLKFSSLRVTLSTDSGKSYPDIPNFSLALTTLSFTWVIGAETGHDFSTSYPSSGCQIQVRDYNYRDYNDLSGYFTVAKP
jgi:hypothetical protein